MSEIENITQQLQFNLEFTVEEGIEASDKIENLFGEGDVMRALESTPDYLIPIYKGRLARDILTDAVRDGDVFISSKQAMVKMKDRLIRDTHNVNSTDKMADVVAHAKRTADSEMFITLKGYLVMMEEALGDKVADVFILPVGEHKQEPTDPEGVA